ncbi:MAG: hypothetical protein NZT92_13175, partial [Abditibacteriales bacterium]|nr:hypothetical protein [Abditibacteriales bacterium]
AAGFALGRTAADDKRGEWQKTEKQFRFHRPFSSSQAAQFLSKKRVLNLLGDNPHRVKDSLSQRPQGTTL